MRRLLLSSLVVTVLATGYATLDAYDRAPGILTLAPVPAQTQSPAASPSTTPLGMTVPHLPAATSVLPLASQSAPMPTPAGLAAAVKGPLADPALGQRSVLVRDATTKRVLLSTDPSRARTPASTAKLLSAAAVLDTLGPTTTLTTRVLGPTTEGRIWLVAGGDTLLSPGQGALTGVAGRAGLADLAEATAAALTAAGRTSVRLGLDTTYAAGPAYQGSWPVGDRRVGFAGSVGMLALSTQRARAGHPSPADPAMEAATAFAKQLRSRGVTVRVDPAPSPAQQGGAALASVESAPIADIVTLALRESDNALTESLTRQAAARGNPGLTRGGTTFGEVSAYVLQVLRARGVDTTGARLADASGLSRDDHLPVRVLADVLDLGVSGTVPGMRELVLDLPVAGLNGTLASRFTDKTARAALGVARAKTGTLTGVQALAGTVLTTDGRLLTFAVLTEGSPPGAGTKTARRALDWFVAALASCGCR